MKTNGTLTLISEAMADSILAMERYIPGKMMPRLPSNWRCSSGSAFANVSEICSDQMSEKQGWKFVFLDKIIETKFILDFLIFRTQAETAAFGLILDRLEVAYIL